MKTVQQVVVVTLVLLWGAVAVTQVHIWRARRAQQVAVVVATGDDEEVCSEAGHPVDCESNQE